MECEIACSSSLSVCIEHIDGAWWPRSMHLVDELPDLVASVSDRLGQVVMVGYRRNGWGEAPPLAEIAGHTIELLGFTSDERAIVILIGEDGRHLSLHVIRPDTSEEVARHALEEAQACAEAEVAAGRPFSSWAIRGRRRRQVGVPRRARRRAADRPDQSLV